MKRRVPNTHFAQSKMLYWDTNVRDNALGKTLENREKHVEAMKLRKE